MLYCVEGAGDDERRLVFPPRTPWWLFFNTIFEYEFLLIRDGDQKAVEGEGTGLGKGWEGLRMRGMEN